MRNPQSRLSRGVGAVLVCALALVGLGVSRRVQTLNEPTDWLRDFPKAEANVASENWRDQYRVAASSCNVTIFHDTEDLSCTKAKNKVVCDNWPHSTTQSFRHMFNLKDIDLGRIDVEPEESFRAFAVKLTTLNERPLVAHAVKMGNEFRDIEIMESPHQAYIVLRTRDAAERVAQALRHSAALCGAKRSPF